MVDAETEPSQDTSLFRRILFMVGLIVAGEAIFGLPFHVARFFRSQMLDAFGLTATELGAAQGIYGWTAMIAYLVGGPLADRFSVRTLMAASLVLTAFGGFYMLSLPGFFGLSVLYGYWGFSTILLFWAALVSATRLWGGSDSQGAAFGVLEGGRGALSALVAFAAVLLFEFLLPEDPTTATAADNIEAVRVTIAIYIGITLVAAGLVWAFVPNVGPPSASPAVVLRNIGQVARLPAVWLQAVIVVCAYVGFKGLDNYQLFAVEAYRLEEIEASKLMTYGFWTRAVAAVGAGLLGDRIRNSRVILLCFALLLVATLFFALTEPSIYAVLFLNILLTCTVVFALRAVYFALFEEANIPSHMTGVAVGIVSFIGFTPETFVMLAAGLFTDAAPGLRGHQNFFLFLAAFAAVGVVATLIFGRLISRNGTTES
ncbi:MAG: MFS transporter [Myxococcota bacterium]